MSKIKELFKNTSWLLISQIITSIFGFIWIILLARYLGVSDFGTMNFAISFATILSIFIDLGINTYTTRDLSRDNNLAHKYIGNAIPLKASLSLIIFIFTLLILAIMNYNLLTIEVVLIFTIHMIFLNIGNLFNGVFQAYGKLKFQAIGIILNSSIVLIGTLFLIYFNLGLISVALTYLMGSLFTLIYLYSKIRSKIITPKIQFDLSFWKNSLKNAIPFGTTGILSTLYYMIDTVMLSMMIGSTAAGIYTSAYKIITVFITLYTVYNIVIFPLMSKLYKNFEDLLKTSYEKSVKYLLMIMLPIAIGINIYSYDIITLIFGNAYYLAEDVLRILIWNVIFVMINGASTNLLNSSNNEVTVTKINILACLINIILNFILIYSLSYIGASIATVITGIIICILMNYVIRRKIFKQDISLIYDIIKIIISGLTLAVILVSTNLNFLIAIPISIIIYIIMLFLTKSFDATDKAIIKEIIRKK